MQLRNENEILFTQIIAEHYHFDSIRHPRIKAEFLQVLFDFFFYEFTFKFIMNFSFCFQNQRL